MVKTIINTALFLVFMILVAKGNTVAGYTGIGIMSTGIAGLLGQLYLYNKKYQ